MDSGKGGRGILMWRRKSRRRRRRRVTAGEGENERVNERSQDK